MPPLAQNPGGEIGEVGQRSLKSPRIGPGPCNTSHADSQPGDGNQNWSVGAETRTGGVEKGVYSTSWKQSSRYT